MYKYIHLFIILLFVSCSYSYFNKTYNQREYFQKTEKEYASKFPENDMFSRVDTNDLSTSMKFGYRKVSEKHVLLLQNHPKTSFKNSSFILHIRSLYRLNQWENVIFASDKFLQYYKDDKKVYDVLYFKALSFLYLGKEDEAMKIFEEMKKFKEGVDYLVTYYETLADLWIEKGSKSKAIDYLLKALEVAKKPNVRFRLYKKIGIQYSLIKKYDASNENYDLALAINGISSNETYKVYLLKGENLISTGKSKDALAIYEKLLSDVAYFSYKDTVNYTKAYLGRSMKDELVIFDGINGLLNSRGIFLNKDTIFSPERDSLYKDTTFVNRINLLEDGLSLYSDFQYSDISDYSAALFSYRYLRRVFYKSDNKEFYNERIEKCRKIIRLANGIKTTKPNYEELSYEYGEYLLLELNQKDSALGVFKNILIDSIRNVNPTYYVKALYASAYIYINSSDTVNAKPFLDSIMSIQPYSDYAKESSRLLKKEFLMNRIDSLDHDLNVAENFLIDDEYRKSLEKYTYIENEKRYKTEKNYYKALLSKAYLYEEKIVQPDSAFIYYKKLDSLNIDDGNVNMRVKSKLENKDRNEKLMEIQ